MVTILLARPSQFPEREFRGRAFFVGMVEIHGELFRQIPVCFDLQNLIVRVVLVEASGVSLRST